MIFLSGCAETPITEPPIEQPSTHLFRGNFDQIWRNIQLAMRRYPVRINNIDAGVLETDFIKGDKLFSEPSDPVPRAGIRYKLAVRAVKGTADGTPAVQVTLIKNIESQENFFDGYRPVPSDGLEEKVLLYRIGRYVEIDQILARAQNSTAAPKK